MTSEALERVWAVRLVGLRRTMKRADVFKECDQCRSVIPKTLGTCPWCHCYRFNENTETVLATLREMAEVPFPVGSAVVPRINFPKEISTESASPPRSGSPLNNDNDVGFAWQRKREGQ